MRKLTVFLAILLAASVSVAEAASKKRKAAEPEDLNANGKRLVVDALPLMMPSAVMYYMLYQKQVEAQKAQQAKVAKVSGRKTKQ